MENITIAGVEMSESIYKKLTDFNIYSLDKFELIQYYEFKKQGKEFVLQLLINEVEGDYSQLSKGLAEIAEEQDANN